MNPSLVQAMNAQIQEELYSGYLYWAMAAECGNQSLSGFENWFRVQAQEELDHSIGFYKHLLERGAKVELLEIKQPPSSFEGQLEMFEATFKHEQHITGKINDLYALAGKEGDYASQSFLKWYIDEQVEEESTASEMIDKIKLVGDKGEALYILDKELATRSYTPASILSEK